MKIDKSIVENSLSELLSLTDIFLVEIKIIDNSKKIIIKIDKMTNISLVDCAEVHRGLYPKLEAQYPDFELEVSSPGLDAPFKVMQQYLKNVGRQVEITTDQEMHFVAILKEVKTDTNEIVVEKKSKIIQEETISISAIKKIKTVISFK